MSGVNEVTSMTLWTAVTPKAAKSGLGPWLEKGVKESSC